MKNRIDKERVQISGLTGTQISPVISEDLVNDDASCIIITSSYQNALDIAKDISFYTSSLSKNNKNSESVSDNIFVIQEEDPFFFQYEAKDHEGLEDRISALGSLTSGKKTIVITPISGALKKIIPPKTFKDNSFTVKSGKSFDIESLKIKLSQMGYERLPMAESKGQFSVRGGILDVFPVTEDYPIRLDFFDDEIEKIKRFYPDTQKSFEYLDEMRIFPAEEFIINEERATTGMKKIDEIYSRHASSVKSEVRIETEKKKNALIEYVLTKTNIQQLENYIGYFYGEVADLIDYLPKNGIVCIDDPDKLYDVVSLRHKEAVADFEALLEKGDAVPEDEETIPGFDDLMQLTKKRKFRVFTPFRTLPDWLGEIRDKQHFDVKSPLSVNGHLEILKTELNRYIKEGFDITIVCSTDERRESLTEFVKNNDLQGKVALEKGELTSGLELTYEKKVYLWDGDIFKTSKKIRIRKKDSDRKPIKAFTDIKKGDYVVHEAHGIGKYVGVKRITAVGNTRDYLKIKYAGDDMLYIPVDQMKLIQKFIGSGDKIPKISKLSGGEWQRAKSRAKDDIEKMSAELIKLSAERKAVTGYAFSKDTVWQKEFEDEFPYKETDDQLKSIASIKKDMEKPYPMDRLLCGDVGYGKTEVAARAVFKCVSEGKQAAILVPTTILANQHYMTFKKRFEDFPFEIEMLSRFRDSKQQKEIIKETKNGSYDIIIGTHRLLSKDVSFKDLGLLVVDEEQRFGVKHKELIKNLKKNVDVLTLSATPIPRTLHMSLVGLRDMDTIEEPPEDRYPVQTYVMEETEEIIRETIRREIERDGQVYIVYNRVRGIERVADDIRKIVPESKLAVAHGQMNEAQLEDIMISFIEKDINVLVSTTIIESGLDIQNVNTILVIDADKFGLSQLYQLRGRVGRTNRMAYAYFLHKKGKNLSEDAEKRLRAIREFTEFGSGFRIAMRDLEIRGAGNLLGTQQSGHMMAIGYEMYCKLIDEAIAELNGEETSANKSEVQIELDVSAFIPDNYINDEKLKLQIYKEISSIENREELKSILSELSDRFGNVPNEVENLMYISLIRSIAEKIGFSRIRENPTGIVFTYSSPENLDPEKISEAISFYGESVAVKGTRKPQLDFKLSKNQKLVEIIELLDVLVI